MIIENEGPRGPLMRPKDAAAYLGIGLSTFWRKVATGEIPKPTKFFDRVAAIPRGELDALIYAGQERAKLKGHRAALGLTS